jgi:recombination protein RecR
VSALDDLAAELARLPGIGRKTAMRLTYHLLKQPAEHNRRLGAAIAGIAERIRPCERCGNLGEGTLCDVCRDPRRDAALVCVVEEAADIGSIERAGEYRGVYHVLGGRLAPIEGIGPDQLHVEALVRRVQDGAVREVILATNPSMEGEATALYVQRRLAGTPVRVTRIARGLPVGGDLEFADGVTIAQALQARRDMAEP